MKVYNRVQYRAQCSRVQYRAQCSRVQYRAVQHSAVQMQYCGCLSPTPEQPALVRGPANGGSQWEASSWSADPFGQQEVRAGRQSQCSEAQCSATASNFCGQYVCGQYQLSVYGSDKLSQPAYVRGNAVSRSWERCARVAGYERRGETAPASRYRTAGAAGCRPKVAPIPKSQVPQFPNSTEVFC